MITIINLLAGRGAIISQLHVWPFPSTIIMTFGERNRNPGHTFAGVCRKNVIQSQEASIKIESKIMITGLSDAKLCLWIEYLNDKAGRS
jgi:hypothetical protein